jgi:dolichol-phosphate mannosyltransferase
VLVVLCTYNEAQNLPRIVQQLHRELPEADLLVVDDNSPDGTGRWVQGAMDSDPKLYLLQRQGKLGLGTALRAGMEWCLARDYDCLLNLDADLSHPTNKAPEMVATCQRDDCDVAVGSRYIAGGGVSGLPWHRRIISRGLNGLASRLLKLPLTDCSGSYRCYGIDTLRKLDFERLTCTGYGFLEELLVHLHRAGARFIEVPIEFEERSSGQSKLSVSDALGALVVIFRLRSRRSA